MNKNMTLEEFLKKFNLAPLSMDEFAYEASKVTDCSKLQEAGELFLKAEGAFIKALEEVECEMG